MTVVLGPGNYNNLISKLNNVIQDRYSIEIFNQVDGVPTGNSEDQIKKKKDSERKRKKIKEKK